MKTLPIAIVATLAATASYASTGNLQDDQELMVNAYVKHIAGTSATIEPTSIQAADAAEHAAILLACNVCA